MLRRYGRSRRWTRVHDHALHYHWQTCTFIAALRVTGLTAPALFDGRMDGDCFFVYVDQILAPTLQAGDLVVMDNLASHHVEGIRERIEATGAQLWYLLPYSSDLNPIELWFAKLKALLRTARRRTVEERWTMVAGLSVPVFRHRMPERFPPLRVCDRYSIARLTKNRRFLPPGTGRAHHRTSPR